MGLLFVILLHFVAIFIVSSIFALLSGVITFSVSKNNRKRKTFLAAAVPFLFFYSLYISGLISLIIISEIKNTDIGIGDYAYVPLNDSCKIEMIDIPDRAYIKCNGKTIATDVIKINKFKNKIIGSNSNFRFFALDLQESRIDYYSNEQELIENEDADGYTLMDVDKFYSKQYYDVAGKSIILGGIISFVFSVLISVLFCKLVSVIIHRETRR